jgi:hypothetical protein
MSGRDELAARQAALVAALVAGAAPPPDLDAGRIRIQSAALLRKRGRGVAQAAPDLATALGGSFGAAFAQYAANRPRAGSRADDAAAFARYLLGSGYSRDREVSRAARRITKARLPRLLASRWRRGEP